MKRVLPVVLVMLVGVAIVFAVAITFTSTQPRIVHYVVGQQDGPPYGEVPCEPGGPPVCYDLGGPEPMP